MQAYRIFKHSLRQVTGNPGPALRICAVPMAVQFAASLYLGRLAFSGNGSFAREVTTGHVPFGPLAALAAVEVLCGAWMAIAWHRFVLMGEAPGRLAPRLHGMRMPAFIGRSLLLGLSLVALEFMVGVATLLLSLLIAAIGPRALEAIVMIPGGLLAVYLSLTIPLRLSPMLPAAALGADSSLKMAWEATRGTNRMLLVLTLILILSVLVLILPQLLLSRLGLSVFALAWRFVAGCGTALLYVSAITTVYGHYVEKRALV